MNAVLKRASSIDIYAQPSAMTATGLHADLIDALPTDLGELVRVIQHLVVYDVVAADFYGFTIPQEREKEIHIRPTTQLLDRILALDDRPLAEPRPVGRRVVGRCHHFMLLLVATLRSRNIAARARCGFGTYFNAPFFEDHWVCEY